MGRAGFDLIHLLASGKLIKSVFTRLGDWGNLVMVTFNLADYGIDRLNRDERIALASAILRSVVEPPPGNPGDGPTCELSDEVKAELDRRIEAHERNPQNVLAWEDVKAELYASFRK